MGAARILVVDDDPGVTDVLRRGLTYEGFIVDTARSEEEALTPLRERPPNLVIPDILMPGLNGFEVLRRLRAADPYLAVLMLTARDAPAGQVRGLTEGTDDYVVKPFTFEVLVARVRALLRRRQADQPEVLRYADLVLDMGTRRVRRGNREVELTATEYGLLYLLLRCPERVLSKELIMDRVWGYDFGGNTNILEVYIKQLRQKLEAGGERRLIQTVRGWALLARLWTNTEKSVIPST